MHRLMLHIQSLIWAIPNFVILLLLAAFILWRRRQKGQDLPQGHRAGYYAALMLFLFYLAELINLLFDVDRYWVGLVYQSPPWPISWFGGGVSLFLFGPENPLEQQMANLLLFAPLGFFLPLLWKEKRGRRVLLLCFGVSLGVECIQLVIGRTFDLNDILWNTVGGGLGWVCWRVFPQERLECFFQQVITKASGMKR